MAVPDLTTSLQNLAKGWALQAATAKQKVDQLVADGMISDGLLPNGYAVRGSDAERYQHAKEVADYYSELTRNAEAGYFWKGIAPRGVMPAENDQVSGAYGVFGEALALGRVLYAEIPRSPSPTIPRIDLARHDAGPAGADLGWGK